MKKGCQGHRLKGIQKERTEVNKENKKDSGNKEGKKEERE